MSRAYEMCVEVRGFDQERIDAIRKAANKEWPFGEWNGGAHSLTATGQDQLCGGESEEEFTERLAVAIWRANGGGCRVSLLATYLQEMPFEIHVLDQEEFERLKGEEP